MHKSLLSIGSLWFVNRKALLCRLKVSALHVVMRHFGIKKHRAITVKDYSPMMFALYNICIPYYIIRARGGFILR